MVSASAALLAEGAMLEVFQTTLAYRRLAGLHPRGQKLVEDAEILRVLAAFRAIAEAFGHDGAAPRTSGWTVTELEVNPFGVSGGELVALDGLLKFRAAARCRSPRPLASLERAAQAEEPRRSSASRPRG